MADTCAYIIFIMTIKPQLRHKSQSYKMYLVPNFMASIEDAENIIFDRICV